MKKNNCCIVIINHTETLSNDEKRSINKAFEVFGGKRDIFIVLPDNIKTNEYEAYADKSKILKVNSEWLSTYKAYNKTLCSSDFYNLFNDYEYMLVYQTDCWVFEDRLDEFIALGYDYYGAPWPHLNDKVGNGGFSLRKVSKMVELTNKYEYKEDSIENHCDTWFCVTHGDELNICGLEIACNFSLEAPSQKYSVLIKTHPMGLHGNFMKIYWDKLELLEESFGEKPQVNKENKIKILFDHQIFDLQKFGGINRQYNDIADILNKTNEFNVSFTINDKESNNISSSIEHLKKGDFDIFYPTFFSPYFLKYIGTKPFVMSVHDMAAEIYEDIFKRNDLQIIGRKVMCKLASAIEVPTEHTKKDLLRFIDVDEKKIHVVGRALNPNFGNKFDKENKIGFDYILYVGGRRGYKRFDWFVKHISKFLNKHNNIHLICTGVNFTESEKKLLSKIGILDRSHSMYVNDYELASLYKHAKFFVFSSEFEGFGLPILEAYKMDCIALLNDIDVFREITLDNGTYFKLSENESNISEVAERIISLTDEERKKIIETQHLILKNHSTKKYISKFCNMFKSVIKEEKNKVKTALCCIGRNENQYAVEFVKHYLNLGFDKIFIYDNNYDGEEHFEDVLQDFIDKGYVEIINIRNKPKCQISAYNDCYLKHKHEYAWMAFFDFDEFLVLENEKNIKDYLRKECFKPYDCILVNWKIMDDNNLVKNDGRPLIERFTREMDLNKNISYSFPENNHVKSIVKCGNDVVFKTNPHVPSSYVVCCDSIGNPCDSSPFKKYIFKGAYLKHFMTKTIQEWYEVKSKRGYPDGNSDFFKTHDIFNEFFKRNEKTNEKIEYIKSLGDYKKNTIKNNDDNLDIFICTHKMFNTPVTNNVYKVMDSRVINYNFLGMDDKFYSEINSYAYVKENLNLKKYIGFCQYRRYFSFMDKIPDLDMVFSDYDAIVAKPIKLKNGVIEQYKKCHNIEDLELIGDIIAKKCPEYFKAYNSFIKGSLMFPYNMFIMKKEDFIKYIDFVSEVLGEYIKIIGGDANKRINENKDKYLKDFYPNSEAWYQYRIGGYLGERLTSIFIIKNFRKLFGVGVKITENKYKK